MPVPLLRFGGNGPLLHFAPANGFPLGTYRPLFDLLTADHHLIAVPPRALWPEVGPPPTVAGSWRELVNDLLAGLREHKLQNVLAVGHSFGAVVSMLAVLEEPDRFAGLVLLDPTFLPPREMDAARAQRAHGEEPRWPLVEGALRRRDRFESEPEAYCYFRDKELFADWPETALGYYTSGVLREADDREGLVLAWSAAWEAYYYQSIYLDTWTDLPRLDGVLPTLVLAGEVSDTFTRDSAHLARRLLPHATHQTIKGYGHLFPHAAPEATARAIRQWRPA